MTPKWYDTAARYTLGGIFLFGAIDGALTLFFGIYLHGKPPERYVFLLALQRTTYFWAFMKSIQLVGALSLLTNYKPALGVALLIPIASVLFLFYLFELRPFLPLGSIIVVSLIILCRAYAPSFRGLFHDYAPQRESRRVDIQPEPSTEALPG